MVLLAVHYCFIYRSMPMYSCVLWPFYLICVEALTPPELGNITKKKENLNRHRKNSRTGGGAPSSYKSILFMLSNILARIFSKIRQFQETLKS